MLPEELKKSLIDKIASVEHARELVVDVMFELQDHYGYLSDEALEEAFTLMYIAEGSDWFWWFGDYNPADSVSDFEALFRLHLSNLYQLLGQEPPDTRRAPLAAAIMLGVVVTVMLGYAPISILAAPRPPIHS